MTDEELRSTIEQVKAQVKAKPENAEKSDDEIDEEILDGFFKSYTEGKMSKEDLGAIVDAMGYEFTEEFDKDPEAKDNFGPEDTDEAIQPEGSPSDEGSPSADNPEDTTKEELEDVRTIKPGEDVEEFKDKIEDVKEDDDVPADDEEEERKKASELWKIDLNK